MSQVNLRIGRRARILLVALALITFAESAWAILGVWRRTAVRTAVVVGSVDASAAAANSAAAASANANAAAEAAAATSAQQAAAASAQQAAAAATSAANPPQTPEQKLAQLQSLYDQKLISESDYEAAKTKILDQMTQ